MSSTNSVTKKVRWTRQAVGAFIAAAAAGVAVISGLITGRDIDSFVSLLILALAVGVHSLRAERARRA